MDPVIWAAVIAALATIAAAIISAAKAKQRHDEEITPPIVLRRSSPRDEAKREFMSDKRMLELATDLEMQAEEGDIVELIDRKQDQA